MLLFESRVVMSSLADSGHSNWTLTQLEVTVAAVAPWALAEGGEWTPAAHDQDPRHSAARSWRGRTAALKKLQRRPLMWFLGNPDKNNV